MSDSNTTDTETPEGTEESTENPRTVRSREKLAEACNAITALLDGKGWVSSNTIHTRLKGKVSEGMFGRAKAELNIVHRRVRNEKAGKAEYQWCLPDQVPAEEAPAA